MSFQDNTQLVLSIKGVVYLYLRPNSSYYPVLKGWSCFISGQFQVSTRVLRGGGPLSISNKKPVGREGPAKLYRKKGSQE